MAAYCKRCSLHIPDGFPSCRMCGSAVLTEPPAPTDNTMLLTEPHQTAEPGFSKWLFFVGLSLIAAPALCIYAIVSVDIPALFTDSGRLLLLEHPGSGQLYAFEICMNALLALAALALNFLFYRRNKYFPMSMVGFVGLTFIYRLGVAAITHGMYPNQVLAHSAYELMRYILWGAAMAGYLLLNRDVGARFQN